MSPYDQQFQDAYSPCSPHSCYHDLNCGHRVQVEHNFGCGSNCRRAVADQPYVCPECLIEDVRLDMQLDSLTLMHGGRDDAQGPLGRDDKLRNIVDGNLQRLLKQGYRVCKVAPKLDPALQFFNQFLEEEGFGGVGERATTPKPRQYKRPGKNARTGLEKKVDEVVTSPTRVEQGVDDEATEAVREALHAFALASGSA